MRWDAEGYQKTCGRVTEHGAKLVGLLRGRLRHGKVLDLGCGTGALTNEIAKFSDEAVGIDLSAGMVKKAKTLYPNIRFFVMDACALEWDGHFDAIFSNAVLHFIKAQDVLLDSVYKALVNNGLFICEFGAAGNTADLLRAVERVLTKRGKAYSLRFYYPTEAEYRSLLEKHGFHVEAATTYDLDTRLIEGEAGLRDWVGQIFNVELDRLGLAERGGAISEIESALKDARWDGSNWHLANRRLRVVARKAQSI